MIDRQTRLLEMAREDATVRAELAASGELFGGYHPRMEAVHLTNAHELAAMLADGWPSAADVGEEGQRAAWLIVQHAISLPGFQRQCRDLLQAAVDRGDAPGWQLAMLTDRIRVFEGRPQIYGTQFDWDDDGQMSPLPIEDSDCVDERRASVGLESLAEATARHRREAREHGERAPADRAGFQARAREWAHRVGWR